MIKILAGMKDWSPGEWGLFFGFLSTFITVTLVPSLLLILNRIKASEKVNLDGRNQLWSAHESNTKMLVEIAKAVPVPAPAPAPVVIFQPSPSGNSGSPSAVPGTNPAPSPPQGPPGA